MTLLTYSLSFLKSEMLILVIGVGIGGARGASACGIKLFTEIGDV